MRRVSPRLSPQSQRRNVKNDATLDPKLPEDVVQCITHTQQVNKAKNLHYQIVADSFESA